ncbi:MAG: hypothetical protein MUC99_03680 [Anaerolineae bacterium]|jgi:hypothetical protein|nr:hypothetical protein [Anaerolineae bacterium]
MSDADLSADLARYQALVAAYEAIDERIDAFLASRGISLDKMSDADKLHYREMCRERDDVHNEMRALEQMLFGDDAG